LLREFFISKNVHRKVGKPQKPFSLIVLVHWHVSFHSMNTESLDCMPRNSKFLNSLLVRANPINGKVRSVACR